MAGVQVLKRTITNTKHVVQGKDVVGGDEGTKGSERPDPYSQLVIGRRAINEKDRTIWESVIDLPGTIMYAIQRDKSDVVWSNIVILGTLQVVAFWGVCRTLRHGSYQTLLWGLLLHYCTGLGVTAGMHRLWSHRSYKASLPLRLFLLTGATLTYENSVHDWVRDHRLHHKCSETDLDPHDSRRGLFFAHMGWLMVKKHDAIKALEPNAVDTSDLLKDPLLNFQHRFYIPITVFLNFLTALIPVMAWDEDIVTAVLSQVARVGQVHHITWFINSIAHWEGETPYDNTIWPVESIVPSIASLGEGWHNFHHRFPNDYRTSDFKPLWARPVINFTWLFLDICIALGLASDPIVISDNTIRKVTESMKESKRRSVKSDRD